MLQKILPRLVGLLGELLAWQARTSFLVYFVAVPDIKFYINIAILSIQILSEYFMVVCLSGKG